MRQYFLDLSTQSVHNRLNKLQSYSLPSSSYVRLTLGASGTEYVAPADGWFYLFCTYSSGDGVVVGMYNANGGALGGAYAFYNNWGQCRLIAPAKKGHKLNFYMQGYNPVVTNKDFRFVYANGSQPA